MEIRIHMRGQTSPDIIMVDAARQHVTQPACSHGSPRPDERRVFITTGSPPLRQ